MKKKKTPRRAWFAGLSHRLRQPLGALFEEFPALLARADDDKRRALLRMAQRETQALLSQLNEILDLTRLEEGNFHLARDTFDLLDLLESVRGELVAGCAPCGGVCEFLLHPETPALAVGDAGRTRQMLAHLVSLWPAEANAGAEAVFSAAPVRETADGFVMRFSAYFEASAAVAAQRAESFAALADRAGADCALCADPTPATLRSTLFRRLAAAMGGETGAEVRAGGIEVWCTLAFGRAVVGDGETDCAAALGGRRALFIDVDGSPSTGWRAALAEWECPVEWSGSLAAGLRAMRQAAARKKRFEVVVIFAGAGGQAAEDFGRAVRADRKLGRPTLALAAATGRRGDAARLREIGFAVYLIGPVDEAALRQALAMALGNLGDTTRHRVPQDSVPRALITRHTLRELRFRHLRVGVVQPDAMHRLSLLRQLEKLGCHARARQADDVALLRNDDVLLVDFGAVDQLRKALRGAAKQPDVIGLASVRDSRRKRDGLTAVLAMPVSAAALRVALGTLVEHRVDRRSPGVLAEFGGDAPEARVALRVFADEMAKNLRAFEAAVKTRRFANGRRVAAAMNDAAESFGLDGFAKTAAGMAAAAAARDNGEAAGLAREMKNLLAQLQRELSAS
jgi:hypothetical protein